MSCHEGGGEGERGGGGEEEEEEEEDEDEIRSPHSRSHRPLKHKEVDKRPKYVTS